MKINFQTMEKALVAFTTIGFTTVFFNKVLYLSGTNRKGMVIKMNDNFPRLMVLLRKEKGISQKLAAEQLGVSQALLSHYEKGIRECGLDFLCNVADNYNVSVDYLLGRTSDRQGAFIGVDDISDPDSVGRENMQKGKMLALLNKKLIFNSLNIIFDLLSKSNSKDFTLETSGYLSMVIYDVFRLIYSIDSSTNLSSLFSLTDSSAFDLSDSAKFKTRAQIKAIIEKEQLIKCVDFNDLSQQKLEELYPAFASSLFNVIMNAEKRAEQKK